jgi:hypothetical protein
MRIAVSIQIGGTRGSEFRLSLPLIFQYEGWGVKFSILDADFVDGQGGEAAAVLFPRMHAYA